MSKKRTQKPKSRPDARVRAEIDRARSNAGGPHRLATQYTRKQKHRKDWS